MPVARTKNANRKTPYDRTAAAGKNSKQPTAAPARPTMIPFLNPIALTKRPAGIDIRPYAPKKQNWTNIAWK